MDPYLSTFPRKRLRSEAVSDYCRRAQIRRVVLISCGNASNALREHESDLLTVTAIAPRDAPFQPGRWLYPSDIARAFPGQLDATPGHLPFPLMLEIADLYKRYLEWNGFNEEVEYTVPTGSGETVCCLALAFPHTPFVADYTRGDGTGYDPDAPLNRAVELLASATINR